jgi:hypothetical protein
MSGGNEDTTQDGKSYLRQTVQALESRSKRKDRVSFASIGYHRHAFGDSSAHATNKANIAFDLGHTCDLHIISEIFLGAPRTSALNLQCFPSEDLSSLSRASR